MNIPDVFLAVILIILSPANAEFTDVGIPPNLRGCFRRMSQSSSRIFSPASRQRYCLKQYLNRRHREDWLPEPPPIADTDDFKAPDLTPFEPQFQDRTPFWSPPIKRWPFQPVTNFWQPKTQFWPVVHPSLNRRWPTTHLSVDKVFKPTTKAPKITTTHSFHTQKPETTTSVPISNPIQTAPLDWRQKPFNTVPSNPPQTRKVWRAPMWSVVPHAIKDLGKRFNNQWGYPNWSLDYPWNGYYNNYNVPEYPYVPMDWIPE